MKNRIIVLISFIACLNLSADTLTLSKAYELALKNSNKIKSANYIFESKKEDMNQYTSRLYPQVTSKISYTNNDRELNNLLNRSNYNEKEVSVDYNISINQKIYDGEIYSKINAEEERLKLYDIKLQVDKQELFHDVLKLYISILKHNNRISLLTSQMQYQKYFNESIKKKFDMKLANKMDMLKSEVIYNTSKIDLNKEKKLLRVSKSKLKHLIGDIEYTLPKINYNEKSFLNTNYINSIIKDDESYLSSLKIKQALISTKFAKEEINNARSAHLPKLSLDLSYTKYDSDDISSDYENAKRLMLMLTIPIYQGGAISSKVESSKLMYSSTLEDLKLVEKESKEKFYELKAEYFSSVDSFALYKESLASANLYSESIKQGFENGLKSVIDVYDAKVKLDEIKYEYVDSLFTMIDSYIGLLIMTNNFDKIEMVDKIIEG